MTLFLDFWSVSGAGALWPSFQNQAWSLNGDKWGECYLFIPLLSKAPSQILEMSPGADIAA